MAAALWSPPCCLTVSTTRLSFFSIVLGLTTAFPFLFFRCDSRVLHLGRGCRVFGRFGVRQLASTVTAYHYLTAPDDQRLATIETADVRVATPAIQAQTLRRRYRGGERPCLPDPSSERKEAGGPSRSVDVLYPVCGRGGCCLLDRLDRVTWRSLDDMDGADVSAAAEAIGHMHIGIYPTEGQGFPRLARRCPQTRSRQPVARASRFPQGM